MKREHEKSEGQKNGKVRSWRRKWRRQKKKDWTQR